MNFTKKRSWETALGSSEALPLLSKHNLSLPKADHQSLHPDVFTSFGSQDHVNTDLPELVISDEGRLSLLDATDEVELLDGGFCIQASETSEPLCHGEYQYMQVDDAVFFETPVSVASDSQIFSPPLSSEEAEHPSHAAEATVVCYGQIDNAFARFSQSRGPPQS